MQPISLTTQGVVWLDNHLNGQIQGHAGDRVFTIWSDELDDWYFTVEELGKAPLTCGTFQSDLIALRKAERWQINRASASTDSPTLRGAI